MDKYRGRIDFCCQSGMMELFVSERQEDIREKVLHQEESSMNQNRSQWASNLGFILAAAGSAIGLGNIWKFPGKVGAYGGGAFILCYIAMVALIGFPVMLAELSMGRATQKNVVGAFHQLNRKWTFAGGIGMVTLFVILSYYAVVGGWVMKYIFVYLMGAGFGEGADAYQTYFVNFIEKPVEPLIWGLLFLVICIYVVVRGVSAGIERMSKILMPVLFLILIACVVRAVTLPGAADGVAFMLTVNPEDFNRDTLVGALGQAFFHCQWEWGLWLLTVPMCRRRKIWLRVQPGSVFWIPWWQSCQLLPLSQWYL